MSIKIYLGTQPGQWLISEVLKSSIRRRTKAQVEFHETRIFPLHNKSRVNIGQSLYRFYIPEALSYSDKAIYMDVQSICLADIQELYQLDFHSKGALARPIDGFHHAYYTNIMLLDNARLSDWKIKEWTKLIDKNPSLLREYTAATSQSPIAKDFSDLPSDWNALIPQEYRSGKILFFNDPSSQPWLDKAHPQYQLFKDELDFARETGIVPKDAIESEIQQGKLVS